MKEFRITFRFCLFFWCQNLGGEILSRARWRHEEKAKENLQVEGTII